MKIHKHPNAAFMYVDNSHKKSPYGFRDNLLKMLTKKIDLYEMGNWFEGVLKRTRKANKRVKVRMRKKIRDELFLHLTKEQTSPTEIMNNLEDRLSDVFAAMPYGFKDDLLQMLEKSEKPNDEHL